jgi:glucosamine--fructose-6-phosphate aminotransferase (isomerizing)
MNNECIERFFSTMKRCRRCILPETFPGIEFDDQDVCNYCRDYKPVEVLGEKELIKTLSRYKNKGREYDMVVPISGGRDSAFVLHQMVTKYKMRVLALTVDSGAILQEGYRNVKRITEVLDIPHVWLKDEQQIKTAQENTKIKFQGWMKNPSIHTIVPVLNSSDKTMNLRMYQYAHDHHIPLVMGGNNVGNSTFEQEHWKTGFLGVFPNERGIYALSDRMKLSFFFGLEYLKNPSNFKFPIFKEYAKGASVYFFESILKPNDVDALGFYDYIYWDEKKIVSTITKEIDWKGGEDTTTTWRIDDAAYPLINYMYYKLVGFTEHDEMYSKMVREEQLLRKDALERCINDHKPRINYVEKTCKEFGVTLEKLDRVLEKYRTKFLKNLPINMKLT